MRKCIFAAAAAVAVLLSDIGGTAVYAGENVPYETYNYDYYEDIGKNACNDDTDFYRNAGHYFCGDAFVFTDRSGDLVYRELI